MYTTEIQYWKLSEDPRRGAGIAYRTMAPSYLSQDTRGVSDNPSVYNGFVLFPISGSLHILA